MLLSYPAAEQSWWLFLFIRILVFKTKRGLYYPRLSNVYIPIAPVCLSLSVTKSDRILDVICVSVSVLGY